MGACNQGEDLKAIHAFYMAMALAVTLEPASVHAQQTMGGAWEQTRGPARTGTDETSERFRLYAALLPTEDPQRPSATSEGKPSDGKSSLPDAPAPAASSATQPDANEQYGKQPKRILGIIPNYRAVSANTTLPPLSFKGAMWLATQDTFDYSNFRIESETISASGQILATVDVRNTGSRAGDEVAQLYTSEFHPRVVRPCHELRGFQRVALQPGEMKSITFTLPAAKLAFYDVTRHDFFVDPGNYELQIGASSDDIRGRLEVKVTSESKQL